MNSICPHLYNIKRIAFLVRDRIGANLLNLSCQPPINRKVIRSKFDFCLLTKMQKADIFWVDLNLQQQGVIQRNDVKNVFTRLNNATYGMRHQVIDRSSHWRSHLRQLDAIC